MISGQPRSVLKDMVNTSDRFERAVRATYRNIEVIAQPFAFLGFSLGLLWGFFVQKE